ncbi:MAG: DUF427 domain-containing protein [Acidimicrobiia bacterium]
MDFEGIRIAETAESVRVLETSHPPVFYIPVGAIDLDGLKPSEHRTFCEFKGMARYWNLSSPEVVSRVGWSYPKPSPGYEVLRDRIAFYPSRVVCKVDGETVEPQAGDFYGGWITPEIKGPFKGRPGTQTW